MQEKIRTRWVANELLEKNSQHKLLNTSSELVSISW